MLLSRGELAGVAGAVFPGFLAPEPAAQLDQGPLILSFKFGFDTAENQPAKNLLNFG